ncbi:MAG: hypothetical protein PVJ89_13345 [Planctomycetota bacterium]
MLDASYALDVEGDAVTGSLAVEVADPAAAADRTRRLSPRELDLGGRGPWLPPVLDPASRARIHAEVSADGSTLHWRAPRALPLGTVDPRDVADGLAGSADGAAAARDAFTAFAEPLLLRRDPLGGQPLSGGVARAWFGVLVLPSPGEAHGVVGTLADLLFALFEEQDPEAAAALVAGGWHRPSADADWSVPRWLLLRDRLGEREFLEGLRAVVDAGAGGTPVGLEEVASAFGDQGGAFVRGWLRGPAGPLVEASWRVDTAGERVLIRVDQRQRVAPGTAAAYAFTLPVTLVGADGRTMNRMLEVSRRKELFQVPFEGEATSVEFDPQGTLGALVKLRAAGDS